MKWFVFIVTILLLSQCTTTKDFDSWDTTEHAVKALYENNFFLADSITKLIESELLRNALEVKVNMYLEDSISTQMMKFENIAKNDFESFIYHLVQGEVLSEFEADSLAFEYFKIAESVLPESHHNIFEKELYYQMLSLITGIEGNDTKEKLFSYYYKLYSALVDETTFDYNYQFMTVYNVFLNRENDELKTKAKQIFAKIDSIKPPDPYVKGKFYQIKASYEKFIDSLFEQGYESNQEALALYSQSNLAIAASKKSSILINIANQKYREHQDDEAISMYNQALQIMGDSKSGAYKKQLIYEVFSSIYQKQDNEKLAREYLFLSNEKKTELKRFQQASKVYETELKYRVTMKEQELTKMAKTKNIFKWQTFLLFPLALALSWLAFKYYQSFVTTRLEKSVIQTEYEHNIKEKSILEQNLHSVETEIAQLEQEKEETIARLQHLKEVVTKDFIVLQDKTKVYVEELMYIQSDDHYLKVHLYEKKDNFVRGRISKIIEELPPNFIRCHRSYIVNENYIEKILTSALLLIDGSEVPVSKKYREYFT